VAEQLESNPSSRFSERHHFLIRRLHSLSGIIPIGAFLCFHLLANSMVLAGRNGAEFQTAVERIHLLGPLLIPVEFAFIFLPLLFHAVVGIWIAVSATPNAQQYAYGANIRFTLQRLTGYIAVAFIVYHVWQMHWLGAKLGGGEFELHDETGAPRAAITTAQAIQASWWIAPVYFIGVAACVYHLANGIWTALITWGITIKPRSQQVAGYFCAAFGVVVFLLGTGALSGFRTFDVDKAETQQTMHATAEH